MPAKSIVRPGDALAHRREWRRWQRGPFARGKGRITSEARYAKIGFDTLVVRRQVFVGERPIIPDTVERPHAKIGGHVALPMRGIDDRAAPDRVVKHGRDIRVPVVDGVIGGRLSAVGIAGPIPAHGQFEVGMIRARLGVIGPIALFEDYHAHARLGESFGRNRARRSCADDHDIGFRLCASIGHDRQRNDDATSLRRCRAPSHFTTGRRMMFR
jgi:hypothetical protein